MSRTTIKEIDKSKDIIVNVPISPMEISHLMDGAKFNWKTTDDKGIERVQINVFLEQDIVSK